MSGRSIARTRAIARRLLTSWDPLVADISAPSLLADWDAQGFAKPYKLEDSEDYWLLMDEVVRRNVLFDCFCIAGWEPNENSLSDAIASLFDPTWGHDLYLPILRSLLRKISEKAGGATVTTRIGDCLDSEATRIVVQRECHGDESRSDVDIFGDEFLIRIEHKMRGASETCSVDGEWQTERLARDAFCRAERLRISADAVLLILLSPEGKSGKSPAFTSLSFSDFAKAIDEALSSSLALVEPMPSAAASIWGFMTFYGRRL